MVKSSFRPSIGEMRHRISLQKFSQADAAGGGYTDTYTTVNPAPVWARIDPIAGGRMIDGVQDQERVTHRFIIRYRSDQADWDWVLFGSRRFHVRTVMNQESFSIPIRFDSSPSSSTTSRVLAVQSSESR